jgi:hypothetical protein
MRDMPRIPRRSREEAGAFPEDVSETENDPKPVPLPE